MPMKTYSDDTELAETDMATLFWVVFREQSIVLSYLPLANNLQSADESLRISVCGIGYSRASLVDIMEMRRTHISARPTSNFEAALGQQLSRWRSSPCGGKRVMS